MKRTSVVAGVASVSAIAAALLAAFPASAELNLKGKTVTVYVAGGVGGGLDTYARTLMPYLQKYLPGEPSVIASNMPGAGGVQAVAYLYNIAPKDGTAIGTTNAGPVSEPLIGGKQLNYDLRKLRWIGSLVKGDTVCAMWHESPVKSLDDALKREVTISATGATSAPTRTALLLDAILHTKFRPIAGYDGGSSLLALERGEVDGTCMTLGSLKTTRPQWLSEKKLVPIVQVALDPIPEYPDVPRAFDLATNADDKAALEFLMLPYEFGNPYYLPAEASDDALATYRRAFDAAMKDPAYLADSEKRRQTPQPRTGAEVEKLVARLFATAQPIIDRTIKATDPAQVREK
ncbi:MAG: Bug family tripartite tricarboxylate transporter substrate binding protein [Gemmatimonas sp.]